MDFSFPTTIINLYKSPSRLLINSITKAKLKSSFKANFNADN